MLRILNRIPLLALLLLQTGSLRAQSNISITYFAPITTDSFRIHLKPVCRNQPMYNLALPNFSLTENDATISTAKIVRNAVNASDCFDVSLVINSSNVMQNGTPSLIAQTISASNNFFDALRSGCDKSSLVTFDSSVTLNAFLTDDKVKLKKETNAIQTAGGKVSMWDAVYLAMQELYINGSQAARSIVIITASDDNNSGYSRKDVIDFARSNNITIHTVALGFAADTLSLKDVATRSGGTFFLSQTGSTLDAIFSTVRTLLREEHFNYQMEFRSSLQNLRRKVFEVTVSGCDQPLSTKQYFDAGSGLNPPAPFTLSTSAIRNTDLFRIDRTGCDEPNEYVRDTLRLRWQSSAYTDPYLNDTITYYWTALIDSSGVTIPITLLSDNNGANPTITLDGVTIMKKFFSRSENLQSDSLVMRIPWYVRAVNPRYEFTHSDTAGISRRVFTVSNPATPAIVISRNRKPNPPTGLIPPDGSRANIDQTSSLPLSWNPTTDINIQRSVRIAAFRIYDFPQRRWVVDQLRGIDSLLYQARVQVVRTWPIGKGAAIGTQYILPAGMDGVSATVSQTQLRDIFGSFISPTLRADSVLLQWTVDVKDFQFTNAGEGVLFDSLWSGIGCRPHIASSEWIKILLVRDTQVVNTVKSGTDPAAFQLEQNFPNPFSEFTTIRYNRGDDELRTKKSNRDVELSLKVYDLLGREVLDLTKEARASRIIQIHSSELPRQGVYYYRLSISNKSSIRKLLFTK